jgi:Spy/CpxP family protein refolding chaperone
MSVVKYFAGVAALAAFCTFAGVLAAGAQTSAGGHKDTQQQLDLAAARADRKALVGENMHLTKEQAAAFWPLYDAYEAKMDKIDDRHAAEVKEFAEHYESLTDADADRKLDEVMAIRQDRLDVQKEFIPKFRAAISSINTTRFFQIDNKLNASIQCALARALPLARPGNTGQGE